MINKDSWLNLKWECCDSFPGCFTIFTRRIDLTPPPWYSPLSALFLSLRFPPVNSLCGRSVVPCQTVIASVNIHSHVFPRVASWCMTTCPITRFGIFACLLPVSDCLVWTVSLCTTFFVYDPDTMKDTKYSSLILNSKTAKQLTKERAGLGCEGHYST